MDSNRRDFNERRQDQDKHSSKLPSRPKGLFRPRKPFEGTGTSAGRKVVIPSDDEDEKPLITRRQPPPAPAKVELKKLDARIVSRPDGERSLPPSSQRKPLSSSDTFSSAPPVRKPVSSVPKGELGGLAERKETPRKPVSQPVDSETREKRESSAPVPVRKRSSPPASMSPVRQTPERQLQERIERERLVREKLEQERREMEPPRRRSTDMPHSSEKHGRQASSVSHHHQKQGKPVPLKRPPHMDPAEEALKKKAVPYEWGRTERFSHDQKKFVERIFSQFAESVTTKLAPLLQTRVRIQLSDIRLRPYSMFVQSLYEPITLITLRMDPETSGLMVIDFPLSFALIDRCLGGQGQPLEEIRYLTDIEEAVLERVVSRFIESYQESWFEVKECKPQYLGMEFNPQTVHIVKPSEIMVSISFDITVSQATGPLYVIIPFAYMKNILPKRSFEEFMLTRSSSAHTGPSVAPLFAKNLDAATVPISVELGSTELSFAELANLEVNDFIKLEQAISEPLRVKVNEKSKFLGRPGLKDRKISVQITKVLQEGDDNFDE